MIHIDNHIRKIILGYTLFQQYIASQVDADSLHSHFEIRLTELQQECMFSDCTIDTLHKIYTLDYVLQPTDFDIHGLIDNLSYIDDVINKCSICFEPYDEVGKGIEILQPCQHKVHYSCIIKQVTTRGLDPKCPLCNSTVRNHELQLLHLIPDPLDRIILSEQRATEAAQNMMLSISITSLQDDDEKQVQETLFAHVIHIFYDILIHFLRFSTRHRQQLYTIFTLCLRYDDAASFSLSSSDQQMLRLLMTNLQITSNDEVERLMIEDGFTRFLFPIVRNTIRCIPCCDSVNTLIRYFHSYFNPILKAIFDYVKQQMNEFIFNDNELERKDQFLHLFVVHELGKLSSRLNIVQDWIHGDCQRLCQFVQENVAKNISGYEIDEQGLYALTALIGTMLQSMYILDIMGRLTVQTITDDDSEQRLMFYYPDYYTIEQGIELLLECPSWTIEPITP